MSVSLSGLSPLDERVLRQIGFDPIEFLAEFLDGGDVPPVYRLGGRLCLDEQDIALWRGKARARAIMAQATAREAVVDLGGGA